MSSQYDQYLIRHKTNVKQGFDWIRENLPDLITDGDNLEWFTVFNHDISKTEQDEYVAYDAYFYGGNKSYSVVQEFNKAWLMHIHRNPHHWQHWVLNNDDPTEGEILIEIPYHYIIEMICDWWSFSWSRGRLKEIFNWYTDHENYIKLHKNTRKKVEEILYMIETKLDMVDDELTHHGIKGQKWGVRRSAQELDLSRRNGIIISEAIDSGTVSTVINRQKQSRHTESGHLPGRSYVKGNLEYSQKLVDQYGGAGRPVLDSKGNWTNKERVDADTKVGIHVDKEGEETETSKLIINYSKTGTHVYPGKDDDNEK